MYAIRSYYAKQAIVDGIVSDDIECPAHLDAGIDVVVGFRITSYNVCYTKLLRSW